MRIFGSEKYLENATKAGIQNLKYTKSVIQHVIINFDEKMHQNWDFGEKKTNYMLNNTFGAF